MSVRIEFLDSEGASRLAENCFVDSVVVARRPAGGAGPGAAAMGGLGRTMMQAVPIVRSLLITHSIRMNKDVFARFMLKLRFGDRAFVADVTETFSKIVDSSSPVKVQL